jgi:superfamily II DNA or RNA helicase
MSNDASLNVLDQKSIDKFKSGSYLSKRGYVLRKSNLTQDELSYLKKTLWGTPLTDSKFTVGTFGNNLNFPVYIETKNKIYIPKIFGIKRYGFPESELVNYSGNCIEWNETIDFIGELYDTQKEAVNILLDELRNGTTGGILSLATGGGKSITTLYALSKLKYKTIIIVNKISLLKQWESEIKLFLPNAEVGILQGQKNIDIENKDIIIAMLQSLARIDYPDSFFENIGVTVTDECHNISSRVFSQVLMKTSSKYTIGLSATPKRSDGCEYIFKWFIGDIVYKSNSEREGLPPIINTITINSNDYKEITTFNKITGLNQVQYTSMLSDLTMMPKRNKLIAQLIKHYVNTENRKILVLSDRREHVKLIYKMLDLDNEVSFTYGLFLGQMKLSELEKSKSCQVILATYQAFGEGVSEKDLNTLILLTPKKFVGHLKTLKNESGKLEQIVGRIFRKKHTEINPLIIDLNDNFSVYKNQSRQRLTFYKQHFKISTFKNQSINLDELEINDISIDCLIQKKKKSTKESENDSLTKNLSKDFYAQCMLD